jgi:tetratricopeptide (TPR) repeat protein
MFAFYLFHLPRWVTPNGLPGAAEVGGWLHGQHYFGPLMYLATMPLRLAPEAMRPLLLNVFSALCASVSLCLLARSVALLPHDRTHEQRQREQSEFSTFSGPLSWLPPLVAVVILGLQRTFWEYSGEATTDMLDLLVFAYVVRCLLEYRRDQRESWLAKFAFVYGLGMSNNWGMVGFLPLFLAFVIAMKGLTFFSPRFLMRSAGFGFLGLLAFFLMPAMNSFGHDASAGFWQAVHATLVRDKQMLSSFPRDLVVLMSLTSVLPVIILSIRWASYFGDNSPFGIFLATAMFHFVHALFFLAGLWVMLDCPISPRAVTLGWGMPFLSFYYLGALALGYFIGYFLIIFGTPVSKARQELNPLVKFLNYGVVAVVLILCVGTPVAQSVKNLPYLRVKKDLLREFSRHAGLVADALPQKGAVLLSDDPFQLYYAEAELSRRGIRPNFLFIDTHSIDADPLYLGRLQQDNPGFGISLAWTNRPAGSMSALGPIQVLENLARNHEVYYIHGSFGYYTECYWWEQRGLCYKLNNYEPGGWDAPLPSQRLIDANEKFWDREYEDNLHPLVEELQAETVIGNKTFWDLFQTKLHLKKEPFQTAGFLGNYYSRALNDWGVQLERAGKLDEAGKTFDRALQINTANGAARINLNFNKNLAAGRLPPVQFYRNLEKDLVVKTLGKRGGWEELLGGDGPVDEPNSRLDLARILADGGLYREAVQQMRRVVEIYPTNSYARLQLANLLIYLPSHTNSLSQFIPLDRCYPEALTNADYALAAFPKDTFALFLTSVAAMQLHDYDKAVAILTRLLEVQPENLAAKFNRAIAYYKLGRLDSAKSDYKDVVTEVPNKYQAYYGLAEISYQQKENQDALKYYQLYLTNAPANTDEAKFVESRLKELNGGAH